MKSPKPPATPDVQTRPLWSRAWVLVAAFAVITIASSFIVAGASWPLVLTTLPIELFLLLGWLVACYGIGRSLLGLFHRERSTFQCVSSAALGIGITSIAMLLLGLAGFLSRVPAIAIIVIGVALAAWDTITCAIRRKHRDKSDDLRSSGWHWVLLVLAPFLGIAMTGALVPPGLLWGDEPNGYDVVEYHLEVPREWYEAKKISPLEHNAFSFFPFNVEMQYLLAMGIEGGPWNGMYLAQLMHVAMIALAVGAVYGVVKDITGDERSACAAAVIAGATPWMSLLAPVAYNEGGLLLFGTLAAGWMLKALRDRAKPQAAGVAGVFAGFACGVKLTAVPVVAIALPVVLLLVKWSGRNLRQAIVFATASVVLFSPWLIRNFAWAHNPVFPEGVSVFGKAHFSDDQVERWKRAHSPTEQQQGIGTRVAAFGSQVVVDPAYAWLLLPLTIMAAVIGWRSGEVRLLALLILFHAIFWIGFTHLQGRFFVLLIPWGAMLIAIACAPKFRMISLGGGLVIACIGAVVLIQKINMAEKRFNYFGLTDFTGLTPLGEQKPGPGEPVVLIGDANAFFYQIPASQLHYRTVFDVNVKDGQSIIDAWRGDAPSGSGTIDIINPSELLRFSKTYWKIPAPPPDVMAHEQPYVVQH
jgi:hypothetical protein